MFQKRAVEIKFCKLMYFQISLSFLGLQGIRDMLLFVTKITEKSLSRTLLHVISFTKHDKNTVAEVYLEPSQISMMELLY